MVKYTVIYRKTVHSHNNQMRKYMYISISQHIK